MLLGMKNVFVSCDTDFGDQSSRLLEMGFFSRTVELLGVLGKSLLTVALAKLTRKLRHRNGTRPLRETRSADLSEVSFLFGD